MFVLRQKRWTVVENKPELIQQRGAWTESVRVEAKVDIKEGSLILNNLVSSFPGFVYGVKHSNLQAFRLQNLSP